MKGVFPVAISTTVQPTDQMSACQQTGVACQIIDVSLATRHASPCPEAADGPSTRVGESGATGRLKDGGEDGQYS